MDKFPFLKFLSVATAVLLASCGGHESHRSGSEEVKNVIFLIGDGMGLAHLTFTSDQSDTPLAIESASYVGLSKTHSASHKVTDSAAAGTALATGKKTTNGRIGTDPYGERLTSILERASHNGLATGLVATYEITNATPAAFIGHVESRYMEEDIALNFLETDIDLFFGGGRDKFETRRDELNLLDTLRSKGYTVVSTLEELDGASSGKYAGLFTPGHMPKMREGRGDFLPRATEKALEILHNNNPDGFFIMIEGSMIDGAGYANDSEMILAETVDFDRAVRVAFDFADRHPGTLVVVTADHETGGVFLPETDKTSMGADFGTTKHTGNMVPVYAYGAGAEHFTGVMDNTDIPTRMIELLSLR